MPNTEKSTVAVIKFGGSATINSEGVNKIELTQLISSLMPELAPFLHKIFVIGGGSRVREQQALRPTATDKEKDEIGIKTLEEHADQLVEVASSLGYSVATVPRNVKQLNDLVPNLQDEVMVVSGLQPGQSTDTGAIYSADRFRQTCNYEAWVVILSNVLTIFTADPRKDQFARAIQVANVQRLVSEGVLLKGKDQWKPGMPIPIDPVAVEMLCRNPVERLYFTDARNNSDVQRFLREEPTQDGTTLIGEDIDTVYYQ